MSKMARLRAGCITELDPADVVPAPRFARMPPPANSAQLRPDHLIFLTPDLQAANDGTVSSAVPAEPAR